MTKTLLDIYHAAERFVRDPNCAKALVYKLFLLSEKTY